MRQDLGVLAPDADAIAQTVSSQVNHGINNTDDYIDPHNPSFRAGVLDALFVNNFFTCKYIMMGL